MLGTANDNAHLRDPDDIEDARHDAWRAKIRHKSRDYVGRADLLDLATKTCIELRRMQGQIETLPRLPHGASRGDRQLRLYRLEEIQRRLVPLSDDLEAIYEAMDQATRKQFDAALGTLPKPRELVGQR